MTYLDQALIANGYEVEVGEEKEMFVEMETKPNLRLVSKAQAYGPRKHFFYQAVELLMAYQKNGSKVEKMVTNIQRMYDGYAIRHLPLMEVGTHILQAANGTAKKTENASLSLLTVKYDLRADELKEIAKAMVQKLYVIRHSSLRGGFAVGYEAVDTDGNKIVKAFGQSKHWLMAEIESGIKAGKILVYQPMFQSPSETRRAIVLYVNVTNVSMEELERAMDEASCGAFSIMKEAHGGEELKADKAIKLLSRLSLMMTGSSHFGDIENFAIFYGDMEAFGSAFNDGHGLISHGFVRRSLASRNVFVTKRELENYAGQARFGTVKGFNTVTSAQNMFQIMKHMVESGQARGIIHMDRTRENAIRIERNKDGEFSNMIIVFGSIASLDYFGDKTNLKCMFDISRDLEYCMMDIPVAPKGHVYTSKQICNTLQVHPKAYQVLQELAKETIDKKVRGLEDTDDGFEINGNGDVVRTEVSSDSDYAINLICQLVDNAEDLDFQIRKIRTKGLIDSINRIVNRFNFSVAGGNYKVVGDFGGYFGVRLLEANEIYAVGKKTTDKAVDCIGYRHPLCGIGEHGCLKFVGLADMVKRVMATDLNDGAKYALIGMIKSLMPGIAMFGSTYSYTVAYYSGMDFDGDMVTLIWDQRIIDLVVELPQYYVDFGSSQASSDKFRYEYESIGKSFLYAYGLYGEGVVNPSIGELAGFNVSVIGLITMLQNGQVSPKFVRNLFQAEEK